VGDREHCLTSGMDDYLSKPVSHDQLREVLKRWLPHSTRGGGRETGEVPLSGETSKASQAAVSPVPDNNGDHPLNLPQLENLYGVEDMRELLVSFIRETSELLELIERYCKEKNTRDLAAQIHQLKGLASVMTAHTVAHSCQEFEKAVKEHDWDQASSLHRKVCAELDIVVGFCHKILESSHYSMR
jgi:HPt (histidine-containing phosphotransfer) domain-containing protein